jgi:hypothetical protein
MKRTLILGTLVLVGALSATIAAIQQAPAQAGTSGRRRGRRCAAQAPSARRG